MLFTCVAFAMRAFFMLFGYHKYLEESNYLHSHFIYEKGWIEAEGLDQDHTRSWWPGRKAGHGLNAYTGWGGHESQGHRGSSMPSHRPPTLTLDCLGGEELEMWNNWNACTLLMGVWIGANAGKLVALTKANQMHSLWPSNYTAVLIANRTSSQSSEKGVYECSQCLHFW